MADTRQQIKNFIQSRITDALNRQNTASVVRSVLYYIVDNLFNIADDDLPSSGGGSGNIDGGNAFSIYTSSQVIDAGQA